MTIFGGPVRLVCGEAEDFTSTGTPEGDVERVRQSLLDLGNHPEGSLRLYRARPTAAFAPRDLLLKDYGHAADAMRELGFVPVERRTGGQLAIYDESALVIDLVAPHPESRLHVIERFAGFSATIVRALQRLGIDARTGAVPGEYCPGDYSINAGGKIKIVGVAQRVNRLGYHLGAVIGVSPSVRLLEAVAMAYRILGLPFDAGSFGAVAELNGGIGFPQLREALLAELGSLLAMG